MAIFGIAQLAPIKEKNGYRKWKSGGIKKLVKNSINQLTLEKALSGGL
jgi:hypothetical protein